MSGLLISSLYQSVYLDITIKGKFKIFSNLSVLGQVFKSWLIVKVNNVSKVTFFGFINIIIKTMAAGIKPLLMGLLEATTGRPSSNASALAATSTTD